MMEKVYTNFVSALLIKWESGSPNRQPVPSLRPDRPKSPNRAMETEVRLVAKGILFFAFAGNLILTFDRL